MRTMPTIMGYPSLFFLISMLILLLLPCLAVEGLPNNNNNNNQHYYYYNERKGNSHILHQGAKVAAYRDSSSAVTPTDTPTVFQNISLTNAEQSGSDSHGQESHSGNSNSNSGSETSPPTPVYVAGVNIETSLASNAEVLQAITNGTQIPLTSMAVVDQDNVPLEETLSEFNILTAEDGYRSLRVGFTTTTDAALAQAAIASGVIQDVRLPITPDSSAAAGGLSENDKIIIGCVVGIGVPVIIAIIVAICCCCRESEDKEKIALNETALVDLDWGGQRGADTTNTTRAPAVPIKQHDYRSHEQLL